MVQCVWYTVAIRKKGRTFFFFASIIMIRSWWSYPSLGGCLYLMLIVSRWSKACTMPDVWNQRVEEHSISITHIISTLLGGLLYYLCTQLLHFILKVLCKLGPAQLIKPLTRLTAKSNQQDETPIGTYWYWCLQEEKRCRNHLSSFKFYKSTPTHTISHHLTFHPGKAMPSCTTWRNVSMPVFFQDFKEDHIIRASPLWLLPWNKPIHLSFFQPKSYFCGLRSRSSAVFFDFVGLVIFW